MRRVGRMAGRRPRAVVAALVAAGLVATACSGGGGKGGGSGRLADPGKCTAVDVASSPEKLELLTKLADDFNRSDAAKISGGCAFVRVQSKASGAAEQALAAGWDAATDGPRPVIWTPAASSWGTLLDEKLSEAGKPAMAPTDSPSFQLTPLVIAMPRPMAEALGWPKKALGWSDILNLARDRAGWGSHGHPEWGPFRLGKTNPNFSTSGLNALVAQDYAATGKTSDLTEEDLAKPQVQAFAKGVESSVVHYGDTTLTFLNNWYRADQRGNPYQYVSAVAVEEKSVLDYNAGNPDGILSAGETPRPPRVPLVAIYPREGTLYSDSPLFTLDADWVTAGERTAAKAFVAYVQTPRNQRKVLKFGFRPGNPDVKVAAPITAANGLNPAPPQTLLEVPQPAVLAKVLDDWATQRRSARVLVVIDISGSMGDPGDPASDKTKLDLAKAAAVTALSQFKDDDQVGLWAFSTGLGDDGKQIVLQLVPPGRVGDVREQLATRIGDLVPTNGTPLYQVTQQAYDTAVRSYDPARINAVVLLTDGRNDDGDTSDDRDQLNRLINDLSSGGEGQASRPVRVFPIAYGSDADLPTLRRIAEASSGAVYDSSDPTSIDKVFTAVLSNF